MQHNKKVYGKMRMVRASVTVETTLIMPMILACFIFLIVINGYLHDMVVMNGRTVEVLYSETEDTEKLIQENLQGQLFWQSNVEYSKDENPLKTTIIWKNKYSFPLKGIMNMVINETEPEVSGKVEKQTWSMSQIIRYVDQN
ncbi:MAG: hypothetical protein PUG60_02190 [Lachnospiraceae bacterium]|nr:hypothetical protein [Lachnospiraceae bacterium]MDY4970711.1 hypothetical protein [Lachnospiraceae bacterium]